LATFQLLQIHTLICDEKGFFFGCKNQDLANGKAVKRRRGGLAVKIFMHLAVRQFKNSADENWEVDGWVILRLIAGKGNLFFFEGAEVRRFDFFG